MSAFKNTLRVLRQIGLHPLAQCWEQFVWYTKNLPDAAELWLDLAAEDKNTEAIYFLCRPHLPPPNSEEDTRRHAGIICAIDYCVRVRAGEQVPDQQPASSIQS